MITKLTIPIAALKNLIILRLKSLPVASIIHVENSGQSLGLCKRPWTMTDGIYEISRG
jgi:hypothetical protein